MYGQDSGYKGFVDNMIWQILELQKRFVNRNYILQEIIGNMVTCYCFHEENLRNYPMNAEISLNWCRGFYHAVYAPNEKYITEELFNRIAAGVLAGHNVSAKGIIPSMSLKQFMKEMKKPVEHLPNETTCGATPAGYIPPITSPDWPVTIIDYFDNVDKPIKIDSDTNHSRYGGMKQALGQKLTKEDYDLTYDGTESSASITPDSDEKVDTYKDVDGQAVLVEDEPKHDTDKCAGECSSCGRCTPLPPLPVVRGDSVEIGKINGESVNVTEDVTLCTQNKVKPFEEQYQP